MTPLMSWILVIPFVAGVTGLLLVAVWQWRKLDAWVWNYLDQHQAKQEYAEFLRPQLEARGYRMEHAKDGTPVFIRVNLITPARPKERAI